MGAGHEVEVFDASATEPADRFDAWRAAVDAAYVPLRARTALVAGYQGGLIAQDLGDIAVSEVTGSPVRVWRDRATIAASNPGVYKVGLQLQGYCVLSQDGREAALTPGDLAIYDTTRPYTLDFAETFRMFVLVIPRDRLGLTPAEVTRLTAQRVSGRQGLGALAAALLGRLGGQVRHGGADPDPRAVNAVVELTRAVLAQRLESEPVPSGSVVLSAAKAWIDAHLADPALGVEAVALAQHVSVRYLQKLFADHGTTVSGWIRDRRVQRCKVDLLDPALASHPVAAIGARWGFGNPSSFTRTFRTTVGMTPGEFRAARR